MTTIVNFDVNFDRATASDIQLDLPGLERHLFTPGIGDKTKAQIAIHALHELKRMASALGLESIGKLTTATAVQIASTEPNYDALLRFPGWGPLKYCFQEDVEGWAEQNQQLQRLLTETEYLSARAAILNAHYTTPGVIEVMGGILSGLGYTSDKQWKVLDPSCGIGYFHHWMRPHIGGQWTMIDLDPVSAAIAHILTPGARVVNRGFQDVPVEPDSYDLVVSNFPFDSYKVHDRLLPQFSDEEIHNYFLGKSLYAVKPGGMVAMITSSGFLGSGGNGTLRMEIAQQARLIAAFRLPSNAFLPFGTEVTTDVLIFQKREKRMKEDDIVREGLYYFEDGWVMTSESSEWSNGTRKYFRKPHYYKNRSEHQLGLDCVDKLYGDRLGCKPFGDENTQEVIARFRSAATEFLAETLPELQSDGVIKLGPLPVPTTESITNSGIPADLLADYKIGEFFEIGDCVYQKLTEFTCESVAKHQALVRYFLRLYRSLELVLENQSSPSLENFQQELQSRYDEFIRRSGAIVNSPKVKELFDADWRYDVLCSLEVLTSNRKKVERLADVFTKQVGGTAELNARSAEDALFISLDQRGFVDLPYMAEINGKSEDELRDELLTEGLIFFDPQLQRHVYRDEYLSGNVVRRLAIAKEHNLEFNVTALTQVQPLYILPPASPEIRSGVAIHLGGGDRCNLDPGAEISIRLGAPVPVKVIEDYLKHLMPGLNAWHYSVKHSADTNTWSVDVTIYNSANEYSLAAGDFTGAELLEMCLNLKNAEVRRRDADDRMVIDPEATAQARSKQQELRQRFVEWVWTDQDRALMLTQWWNDRFNNIVERKFDGRYLTFPGLNPAIKLRAGQKNAVAHGIQNPSSLMAQGVGFGKTLVLICLAMKLKQMGLVKKPMISVLNSTLPQWKKAIQFAYPGCKLLAPEPSDFEARNRRKLFAKIAAGDWDIVLLPHSQFSRIPMSDAATLAYYKAEAKRIKQNIRDNQGDNPRRKNFIVKTLERNLRTLEKKMEKLKDSVNKDNTLCWELLGVDALFVDEFHVKFKKCGIQSKLMGVAGIDLQSSAMGMDLRMKVRYLQSLGGRVVYASGTPITNTIGELFTIMMSLQLEDLEEAGIHSFDAWVASFGEIVTAPEISSVGKFVVKSRLSRFTNLDRLVAIYKRIANVVLPHELRRPADWDEQRQRLIEQGKGDEVAERESLFLNIPKYDIIQVACPPSAAQKAYMDSLVVRAERCKSGAVEPTEDNMLKVTGDGRKACIDMRNVAQSDNYLDGKLNRCAINIFKIWKATECARLTQIMFCDFGTFKQKTTVFDNYKYLRDVLIAMGVPAEEIKIIHECSSDSAKLKLQDDMNSGQVRILLASTEKGGIGLNIQQRLVAEHHIDAPWRPDGIEQREGRMLRDGNLCPDVLIFRYVSQGKDDVSGFDSFLWQILETKANAFTQVMGASSAASGPVQDISPVVLSYAQMKALASGDTRILRKAEVDQQVAELSALLKGAERELTNYKINLGTLPDKIDRAVEKLERFQSDSKAMSWPDGYTGLVPLDGEVDDSIDVPETDENVSNNKLKQYKPLEHVEVKVILSATESEVVTNPRKLGSFIVEAVTEIFNQKAMGAHRIAEIRTPECGDEPFRIVVELRGKTPQSRLIRGDSDGYPISVSNATATVRSIFTRAKTEVDRAIADETYTLERLKRNFAASQPQIDQLQEQVSKIRMQLDPLIAEQKELDKIFAPDSGSELIETGDSGGGSDSDDDEEEYFFGIDSSAAFYDGVEPWIPPALLRAAVDDVEEWESRLPGIALEVLYQSGEAAALDVETEDAEPVETHEAIANSVVEAVVEPTAVEVVAEEVLTEAFAEIELQALEFETVEIVDIVATPEAPIEQPVKTTAVPIEVLQQAFEPTAFKVKRGKRRTAPADGEPDLFALFG